MCDAVPMDSSELPDESEIPRLRSEKQIFFESLARIRDQLEADREVDGAHLENMERQAVNLWERIQFLLRHLSQFSTFYAEEIRELETVKLSLLARGLVLVRLPPRVLRKDKVRGREVVAKHLLGSLWPALVVKTEVVLGGVEELRREIDGKAKEETLKTKPASLGGLSLENNIMETGFGEAAVFDKISIVGRSRAASGGKNSKTKVTEQLLSLRVRMTCNVPNYTLEAETLSRPIVCVAHDSQRCTSDGTLLWLEAGVRCDCPPWLLCYCFLNSTPGCLPVHQVLEQLRLFWNKELVVGEEKTGLRSADLKAIEKVLLATCPATDGQIHRENFFSNRLNGGECGEDFSFWAWFWHLARLCRFQLKDPAPKCHRSEIRRLWFMGAVAGFLNRAEAEVVLSGRTCGTYLLRFSQKILGTVILSGVASPSGAMTHKRPFEIDDVERKGIVARILAEKSPPVEALISASPYDLPGADLRPPVFRDKLILAASVEKRRGSRCDGYDD